MLWLIETICESIPSMSRAPALAGVLSEGPTFEALGDAFLDREADKLR
jgi:hypothetical protein